MQSGYHDDVAPTPLQLLALEIDCQLHQVWRELIDVLAEDDLAVVAAALRVAYAIGYNGRARATARKSHPRTSARPD